MRPLEDGGWDIRPERRAGMAEAGALWGASDTFERSTMPRGGHGHKKTSRTDERFDSSNGAKGQI